MKYREFDRDIWLKDVFVEDGICAFPFYPCSFCGAEALKLVDGSLVYRINTETENLLDCIFDESYVYYFRAELKCKVCGECHHVVGSGQVDEVPYYDEEGFDEEYHDLKKVLSLDVKSFFPASPVLYLPESKRSEKFCIALQQSFSLFWSDAASCANKIRTAMEYLLDYPPFSVINTDAKGNSIPFGHRIGMIKENHPEYFDKFDALKSLGNSGSHELNVCRGDLVKAYEIVDSIFYKLFVVPEFVSMINEKDTVATVSASEISMTHSRKRKN